MPISMMDDDAVGVLHARKVDHPTAADSRLKIIGYVFAYGKKKQKKLVQSNPTTGVDRYNIDGDGRRLWSDDEVRKFEDRHPPGSSARLALYLLLYTGARPCDVRTFGRQTLNAGRLKFKPRKTVNSSGAEVDIPVHPLLAAELERVPAGQMIFVLSKWNKPYGSDKSFCNWFHDMCVLAGLPDCGPGGLRGTAATLMAENGATAHQLMAVFGWTKLETAQHYTEKADRRKMGDRGAPLIALAARE
jgi:integrase